VCREKGSRKKKGKEREIRETRSIVKVIKSQEKVGEKRGLYYIKFFLQKINIVMDKNNVMGKLINICFHFN